MNQQIKKRRIIVDGATYVVTSDGKVYGKKKLLNIRPNSDGYACVTLGQKGRRKRYRVHRLVAEIFLPNNDNLPEVDHLDGNRMNPSLDNLEWVSHEENIRRAYEKGSYKGRVVGEKNPRAHLTDKLVLKLREAYYLQGITIGELSDQYRLPWNTVGNAVKGITWLHLPFPEEVTPKSEE